ncbi:Uncharacterised protein [Escherichia coli]|nr:Uncharacterised protein [Escherichia coli]
MMKPVDLQNGYKPDEAAPAFKKYGWTRKGT